MMFYLKVYSVMEFVVLHSVGLGITYHVEKKTMC